MRKGMDPEITINNNGKLVGINLSSDFCAEHEWGINDLKRAFSITDYTKGLLGKEKPIFGIEKRIIRNADLIDIYEVEYEKEKYWMMIQSDYFRFNTKMNIPSELTPFKHKESHIWTAWSENDFGILVDDTYKDVLYELLKEMRNKNVCIGLFGGGIFKNAGLCFFVVSELDEKFKQTQYDADVSHDKLMKAVDNMGIKEKLQKAEKNYIALSPKWKDNIVDGEIIFWLNPYDQQNNNFSWCTEQDLLDWIDNKGKIPKK